MTLDEYIKNPMGKDNAVLNATTRELIRAQYSAKFDNILLRENGKIEYYLYTHSKKNTYWVHAKIPSETVKNFYYVVIFKFYTTEKVSSGGSNLFEYNVRFFSNDPAFVFTHAHVFRENDLFIEELRSKMSKEALKKSPTTTNPHNNLGYVKTIYFAYLLMKNKKLNNLTRFKAESRELDPKLLLSEVMEADEKIALRLEEGSKVSKRKTVVIDKNLARKISSQGGDLSNSRFKVGTTKTVGTIKNKVKTTSKVKRK